ncbi:MAG: hypothetical protein ACJAW1_003266 [Glaciecola sp.]|jgi:hypothetical protein
MKKCELFLVFDEQSEHIKNAEALANVIRTSIGGELIAERHLKQCMSLLCDLAITLGENHEISSKALTRLYIVNDAVNGNSD